MTPPLLSTRHPWQLRFGETPLPPALPPDIDVVRVSMGLGVAAIDAMIDSGDQVGPLLYCLTHVRLLVPVESGTAELWSAAHSECSTGASLECTAHGHRPVCHARFWVAPPDPLGRPTTDPAAFHDRLSLVRSQMRTALRVPPGIDRADVQHPLGLLTSHGP